MNDVPLDGLDPPNEGLVKFASALTGGGAGLWAEAHQAGSGIVVSAATTALLEQQFGRAFRARRRRTVEAIGRAANDHQVTIPEMLERAEEDAVRREFVYQAGAQIPLAMVDSKVRLLADLLVQGALADDGATIARLQFQMRAVQPLERFHIRVLDMISVKSQEQLDGQIYYGGDLAWTTAQITREYPEAHGVIELILQDLSGVRLAIDGETRPGSAPAWETTDFGNDVLGLLRAVGDPERDLAAPIDDSLSFDADDA